MNTQVYVDFDGTIMTSDTTDFLLERFALPEWHAVEDEWAAGRIGSRECMARQVDLIRATPEALDAAVAELEMDAGFPGFLAVCEALGVGATIVSDGLDRVIEATLRRHKVDVPFFANRLVPTGGDRWRLEFPNARSDCAVGAGHCKCAHPDGRPGWLSIVVGDGRSDFCIARRADLVLAKSKLIEECQKSGMPHFAFRSFDEATEHLKGWPRVSSNTGHVDACLPLEA